MISLVWTFDTIDSDAYMELSFDGAWLVASTSLGLLSNLSDSIDSTVC
jgi:hypothetical protein